MDAHFSDHFNDARATDAGDATGPNLGLEGGIIRPQVAADYLETGNLGDGVDLYPFDRTWGGALTAANLCALERGTGGRGTGEDFIAVAQQDFSVGAHIDDQHQIV